jgi:hypothetical protein
LLQLSSEKAASFCSTKYPVSYLFLVQAFVCVSAGVGKFLVTAGTPTFGIQSWEEGPRESIAARYRRWHRDPAIRWALMADADDKKKNADGDKSGDVKSPLLSLKKSGKTDGAGGSGETVRVVREIICATPNWPKLTKTNYTQWALVMKVKMQA